MATKRSLAEQILLLLSKNSSDSEIDEREIIIAVEQTLANVIRIRYFESKAEDVGEVNGALMSAFRNVPVTKDSELCSYYSELPAKTIDLPHGIDINKVAPMYEVSNSYVEVPTGFDTLYGDLQSQALSGRIGFYREGNRIYYVNMGYNEAPNSVYIRMVAGINSLPADRELNIPADMEAQVIQFVLQMYGQKPQEDITNDNVDQA